MAEPVPPGIPEKLAAAGYRFIRILPGSKNPRDKKYTTTNNFLADEQGISGWIKNYQSFEWTSNDPDDREKGLRQHYEGYGNYGVLCSETCVALDLDTQESIDYTFSVLPELKNAYLLQSGSGHGMHIPLLTSNAKTIPLVNKENKNIGHIKAKGGYIVGPTCLHPSGGTYHVLHDGDIPYIPFEKILDLFKDFIKQKPSEEIQKRKYSPTGRDIVDVPIERIFYPHPPIYKNGDEIRGKHPIHGATNTGNLSINTRKNVWRCWRCNTAGGPAHAIAVVHGLVDCSNVYNGMFKKNPDLVEHVKQIATEQYGWQPPVKKSPAKKPHFLEIDNSKTFDIDIFNKKEGIRTDTLPEELPDADAILVDGYPRIGKTHWSELQGIKHKTANIIANTHSVIDQHIRIFSENRQAGQTAVHLEGRGRCCVYQNERKSCDHCPYYPYTSDPSDRGRFLAKIEEVLHDDEILTKETIPDDYCPYFFLKEAAKIADYVFTVPENLEEITGEAHQQRHLTIIDEDTCFANFFPRSVDLAEFVRGPTRNYVINLVEMKWVGIQKWKDYIVTGKKRPKGKKTILRMIEILENIREVLRIKDDTVFNPEEIIHEVGLIDLTIPEPEDTTKQEILRLIERWEIPDTFSLFASALLYPYENKTLDWQGYNPMKLRLIADESKRIYEPPNTKMILIGSTRAEMFLKTLGVKYEAIRINKFQYSQNFVFFVVNGKPGENGRKKYRKYKDIIFTTLKRISNTNGTTRYPLLLLVGTKKEQNAVIDELGGICKGSSDENIQGQKWNYIGGCFNIFYQNSVISRGVDIPFYKTLIALSSDFANPYWSARRKYAAEEGDNDDFEYADWIIDAITVDETTNSILRITPVVGHEDKVPRVVVIGEKDFWKIKPGVVENATTVQVDADQLFDNIEKVLDITGKLEILPEKQDVDEYGRDVVHWYVDTIFNEPQSMKNKTVGEKGKIIAEIITSAKESEQWRMRYSKELVTRVEKAIIDYLIRRDKAGKTITFGALRDYVAKRNKKFTRELAVYVITNLYKKGDIRVDNFVRNEMKSVVRISSKYVDQVVSNNSS